MKRRSYTITILLALLMVLVFAGSAFGQTFPDVDSSHPYYQAIETMAGRGVIAGYTDGNFGPNDPVTRQQFAKMAVKTLGLTVTGSETCPFVDVAALYSCHMSSRIGAENKKTPPRTNPKRGCGIILQAYDPRCAPLNLQCPQTWRAGRNHCRKDQSVSNRGLRLL